MTKKSKIMIGTGVAVVGVAAASVIFERRKEMSVEKTFEEMVAGAAEKFKKGGEKIVKGSEDICKGLCADPPKPELSPIEREKLASYISGMSEEEMRVALANIPIDLMFSHIGSVLEKNRRFAQSIQDAMNILEG